MIHLHHLLIVTVVRDSQVSFPCWLSLPWGYNPRKWLLNPRTGSGLVFKAWTGTGFQSSKPKTSRQFWGFNPDLWSGSHFLYNHSCWTKGPGYDGYNCKILQDQSLGSTANRRPGGCWTGRDWSRILQITVYNQEWLTIDCQGTNLPRSIQSSMDISYIINNRFASQVYDNIICPTGLALCS